MVSVVSHVPEVRFPSILLLYQREKSWKCWSWNKASSLQLELSQATPLTLCL